MNPLKGYNKNTGGETGIARTRLNLWSRPTDKSKPDDAEHARGQFEIKLSQRIHHREYQFDVLVVNLVVDVLPPLVGDGFVPQSDL